MPVRIYDIAKKLGIENKEVLVKAKELGITAARVPSSSLDKITAEYLESHLRPAAPTPAEPPPVPVAPEPILIVSAPPEPPLVVEVPPTPVAPVADLTPLEEPAAIPETPVQEPVEAAAATVAEAEAEAETQRETAPAAAAAPVEQQPPPPAPPPGPRIGELVGRIQLPSRPAPRVPDKG